MSIRRYEIENRYLIRWVINDICNFKCDYCFFKGQLNKQSLKPIDINKLSDGLSELKGDWHFHISGGEPMLEKNIIDICKVITQKHYISLNTNLSTRNIIDFADHIDPGRVTAIFAASHIIEREKNGFKLDSYIEKILYLQKRGFNIKALYVADPDLFNRMKSDFAVFRSQGIEKVYIKTCLSQYDFDGKTYSSGYNFEQKEYLKSLGSDFTEKDVLNQKFTNYHGHLCFAGQKNFLMDRDGNITRCWSSHKNYGNFFEKSFNIETKIRPCPANFCGCPLEGLDYALNTKGKKISIWKEDYIEKISISNPGKHTTNNLQILIGALLDKMDFSKRRDSFHGKLKKVSEKLSRKYIIHRFWLMISFLEKSSGIPFSKIKKLLNKKWE